MVQAILCVGAGYNLEQYLLRVVPFNGAATNLDSCTDFMNVCVTFLADPDTNVPIAKADDREAFLELLGEPFIWKKKSAKREDVAANSAALKVGLARAAKAARPRYPERDLEPLAA